MEDSVSPFLCLISGFVILVIITAPLYLLWRKRKRNELSKESAEDERAARLGPEEQAKLGLSRGSKQTRNILVWVLIGCVFFMLIFARNFFPLVTSPQDITLEQLHTLANPTANWHDYRVNARTIFNIGVQYFQSNKNGHRTYYTYFIIEQGNRFLVVDSDGDPDHLQLPVIGRLFTMDSNEHSRLDAYLKDETALPYVLQVRQKDYSFLLFFLAVGGVVVFIIFILISNRLDILKSLLTIVGNMIDRLPRLR